MALILSPREATSRRTQDACPLLPDPDRLVGRGLRREDRHRHALLPLDDHQGRVDAAALVVELEVVAGEELGGALGGVHGAHGLGDLAAVGDARLLPGLPYYSEERKSTRLKSSHPII